MRSKKLGKEKYSIIITSETDARKKPRSFSLTRRALIFAVSAIFLLIFACSVGTVFSIVQANKYSERAEALKRQVDDKSGLVAAYKTEDYVPKPSFEAEAQQNPPVQTPSTEITDQQPEISGEAVHTQQPQSSLQPSAAQQSQSSPQPFVAQQSQSSPQPSAAQPTQTPQEPKASPQVSQSAEVPSNTVKFNMAPSVSQTPGAIAGSSVQSFTAAAVIGQDVVKTAAAGEKEMKDAIAEISADFQSAIDKRIEALKQKESYDTVKILYDGDLDGDSDTVNNWADVLSVFMVKTMSSGQKLLTITQENEKLLSDIYYEMNNLSIDSEKKIATKSDPIKGEVSKATLIIHVTVNSLTYMEDMSLHDFTAKQKDMLKNLMSPDYYTYFEGLLGIDVYDGEPSSKIQDIIAKLPEGSKGTEIVKAALIRLGAPYSMSKRGTGNYVDCSYFAWWSYNQAGVSIPKSSVEQAQYCYNKKCTVKQSELAPGDLIFWSKTDCDCGRWREIHHVGIYIGNGMIIDASSDKGRVIIRKLWDGTEWKIAFFARPYA